MSNIGCLTDLVLHVAAGRQMNATIALILSLTESSSCQEGRLEERYGVRQEISDVFRGETAVMRLFCHALYAVDMK